MTYEVPPRMRAAVWSGPGLPLTVETVPTPEIEHPEDVLVRVRAAMFGAAIARAVTVGHPRIAPPAVLGTLVAGEVVRVGSAVGHVRQGQPVTFDPHPPCGTCAECRDGQQALCGARPVVEPGAHAEFVRIRPSPTTHVTPVPTGVSLPAAMLTEIVACVLDATDTAGIGPGQDVAVIGCGPVALIQIQLARLRGARRVFCSVNHADRSALVAEFGGIPVSADDRFRERIAELTDGRGVHVVVEAVGTAATYRTAFDVVRTGGTVVGFGGCPPGTEIRLDPNEVHYRRLTFVGSYHYRPGAFEEALGLVASGRLRLEPLITHRVGLSRINEAVRISAQPDCLVLVVEPGR
ncbi:zinc-binding dehydrogenase [Kitasatospora sp. NBC_00085]|uniref:zinc-dependent alcohol dehydrogenase n=1 Tax=unclassified Kitasatospora TaxID=2633591 RepID=UPI00324B02B4